MEIKDGLNNKGLFATKVYMPFDVIYVLQGKISAVPTRESIHVGNNVHVHDDNGQFQNHSFHPNTFIDGHNVTANQQINIGDELTFNYNHSEINMASPFTVHGIDVSGNQTKT